MDRHKYVKVAYHGFRELSREDRQAMYGNTLSRESYDEPDYALIDTLFSLAEAYLFMQLVDFRDAFPDRIPAVVNEYVTLTFATELEHANNSYMTTCWVWARLAVFDFIVLTNPDLIIWQLLTAV